MTIIITNSASFMFDKWAALQNTQFYLSKENFEPGISLKLLLHLSNSGSDVKYIYSNTVLTYNIEVLAVK